MALGLASLLAFPCIAATPTPEALVASLARPAPANTLFAEVRIDAMLAEPLVLSGELAWLGGDHLMRMVISPWHETTDVNAGEVTLQREGKRTRHFSLQRSAELEGVLGSFQALLSGDSKMLLQTFTATVTGDTAKWRLTLDPRDGRLKQRLSSIVIYGAGDEPRCMRMDDTEGGVSVTLFGRLARMALPEPLDLDALEAHCKAVAPAADATP